MTRHPSDMFELDYKIELHESPIDLSKMSEADLRYRFMLGDIAIKAGDVNFSTEWGWVPILDFAFALDRAAERLQEECEFLFEFTESEAWIKFERNLRLVKISASYVEGHATVELSHLADAVDGFFERVIEEASDVRGFLDNTFVQEYLRSRQ